MDTNALFIDLMWQEGTPVRYIQTAKDAILAVILKLGLEDRIKVVDAGSSPLIPYLSNDPENITETNAARLLTVEETVELARFSGEIIGLSKGALDIRLLGKGLVHYWIRAKQNPTLEGRHLPFLLVKEDYAIEAEEYVFGWTRSPCGSTVSTYRFENDPRITNRLGTFAATVIHEFGHLLGAPDEKRDIALEDFLGMHCTNLCVMRQRNDLPEWEQEIVRDLGDPALKDSKPFCLLCQKDIGEWLPNLFGAPKAA